MWTWRPPAADCYRLSPDSPPTVVTTKVPWPGGREDESRVTGDPSDPNHMVKYSGGESKIVDTENERGKAKAYKGSERQKCVN